MTAIFAIIKRLLASNKISCIVTALVVVCATSSGETVLSNGNYTWLLVVFAPFFFVFYDFSKLMHLGASKRDYFARLPYKLRPAGLLHFTAQHAYTFNNRPRLFGANRHQHDGRVRLDGKRYCRRRFAADALPAACDGLSPCTAVHAGTLVRLADGCNSGCHYQRFHADCPAARRTGPVLRACLFNSNALLHIASPAAQRRASSPGSWFSSARRCRREVRT